MTTACIQSIGVTNCLPATACLGVVTMACIQSIGVTNCLDDIQVTNRNADALRLKELAANTSSPPPQGEVEPSPPLPSSISNSSSSDNHLEIILPTCLIGEDHLGIILATCLIGEEGPCWHPCCYWQWSVPDRFTCSWLAPTCVQIPACLSWRAYAPMCCWPPASPHV